MKLRITGGIPQETADPTNWGYGVYEMEKGLLLLQTTAVKIDGHYVLSKDYTFMHTNGLTFGIAHKPGEADERAYKEALNFAELKKGTEPREITDETRHALTGRLDQLAQSSLNSRTPQQPTPIYRPHTSGNGKR